jgi:hypothetical protein
LSQSEGERLDRLEALLSSLLSWKIATGPCSISNYSKENLAGPLSPTTLVGVRKNSRISPKPENNSTNSIVSGLERFNKNNCLTIGLSTKNKSQSYIKWVLDSGATDHMTGNQSLLKNYHNLISDQYFTVANNERIEIKGWGMISIFSKKYLQDVFYVENCSVNLLSISKLSK